MSAAETLGFAVWFLTLPVAVFCALAIGAGARSKAVAGGAAALLGLGLAGDTWQLGRQLAIARWEPAPARVVVSERGPRRNDWSFAYEYEVGGVRHRGSVYTYRPRLRSREDTDRLYREHPVGRQITVFVDPGDASRAAVDAEPSYGTAVAGFALHAWLAVALLRGRRSRSL